LKWQNIDADDLPAAVKKLKQRQAAFKADFGKSAEG
jgi:hypothetical protein